MMCPDCGCDLTGRENVCPNCGHIFRATNSNTKNENLLKQSIELQKIQIQQKERELQMLNKIGQIELINARENALSNFIQMLK